MRKMQKLGYIALGAVFMLMLVTAVPVFAASTQRQLTAHFNNIRIVIDGVLITPRDGLGNIVEPFVVDGTTYLPVRAIAEALGRTVQWDENTQTVHISASLVTTPPVNIGADFGVTPPPDIGADFGVTPPPDTVADLGVTPPVHIGVQPEPVTEQFLTDVAPAHQTSLGGIQPSPTTRYYEFSSLRSGGADGFNMGGTRFVDGMRFQHDGAWAVYNLNSRFTNLSGVVGQIDGTFFDDRVGPRENAGIRFFTDGRMILEVPIENGMLPQPFSIDLTGVNQLRIETIDRVSGFTAGIGNPVLR